MSTASRDARGEFGGRRNAVPWYSPRFWHGMRLGSWLALLARNRFRIHPIRIPMVLIVTFCTLVNSPLAAIQRWRYGRRIAAARLRYPPLFIIGHWRSGTTHMHELLALDERFTSPSTYECFAPEHFLLSSWFFPRLMGFLLPRKRPMDDMIVGFDRPQEDEFALCAMGAPTPMQRVAFPNHAPPFLDLLNLDTADDRERREWQEALRYFVQALSVARPDQRLVLKSPPHTGRVAWLAEMFPGAQFIHLTRDPLALYASTLRLWRSLDADQGLQLPRHEHLEEFVFAACERMYQGFESQRTRLPPGALCEVRYEDLVAQPLEELRRVYAELQLGNFEPVAQRISSYLHGKREYRAASYQLPADVTQRIGQRWAFYFDRYGYATPGEA